MTEPPPLSNRQHSPIDDRYRLITESMADKAFTATHDGAVDYINPQWIVFTGLSRDDIIGWRWTQCVHPEDVGETISRWLLALATGEPFGFEHRLRRRDGVYRWHVTRAHPVRGSDGAVRTWIGSSTDIDDHRRAEHDERVLAELSERLIAAQREVQVSHDALAMVSHDLKTPLCIILMNAAAIATRSADASQSRKQIADIQRAAEQMRRLVEELLDCASLEAHQMVLQRRWIAVAGFVRDAVDAMQVMAASKRIRLGCDIAAHSSAMLGDGERLHRVFANAIGNAIKFTPEGGAITVRAIEAGPAIEFSISDTGIGVAADDLPHIFDRFWRARTSVRQGTGLGLAIAKGIVEAHGGRIWVMSQLGTGTTLFFTVPTGSPDELSFPDR